MSIRKVFAVVSLAVAALAAVAQESGAPARVRGTIESFDGRELAIATKSDGVVRLAITEHTGINGLEAKTLDDIEDDSFIGATAVKDAAGRWQATEIHIFPDEMRGAGDGHYAWDLPESSMTNGAVSRNTAVRNGRTLRVSYSNGETEIEVSPQTKVVALTAGDRSLLVRGAAVFALARMGEGGAAEALAVVAETKGLKPPM